MRPWRWPRAVGMALVCALSCALLAGGPLAAAPQAAAQRCPADPASSGDDVADLIAELSAVRKRAGPAPSLFEALAARQGATLQKLLKAGTDARQCYRGLSVLTFAAHLGDNDSVRLLVQAIGHADGLLDSDGNSGLLAALSNGRFGTAELLLRLGADASRRSDGGLGALHQLAMAAPGSANAWADEQVNLARQLVARGLAPDAPGPQGSTALQLATALRNTSLVAWLLSQGADPDKPNQRGSSAQTVAQRQSNTALLGMFDRARLLRPLRQGRAVDFVQQLAGCGAAGHPVSAAVATDMLLPTLAYRQPEVTRALLACGADANARVQVDNGGTAILITPLVYAAGDLGSLPLVQALLDGGADAKAPSQALDGRPLTRPLDAARKAGHHDIARLLAERTTLPAR